MEYKLIKKYPSLPKDWEEGMIVGLGDRCTPTSFSPCNGKYKDYYVPYEEVVNNSEYWEQVFSYPVGTRVIHLINNNTFKREEDGWYLYSKKNKSKFKTALKDEHVYKGKYFQIIDDQEYFENILSFDTGTKVVDAINKILNYKENENEYPLGTIIRDTKNNLLFIKTGKILIKNPYKSVWNFMGKCKINLKYTINEKEGIGEDKRFKVLDDYDLLKECVKKFPKGSTVRCPRSNHIFKISTKPSQKKLYSEDWVDGIYYLGVPLDNKITDVVHRNILAIEDDKASGIYLFYNGKFAEIVEEKVDYVKSVSINDSIHSVKRLSDGEIFTVGDSIQYSKQKPSNWSAAATITGFELEDSKILIKTNKGQNLIHLSEEIDIRKAPKLLFVSEDKVEIREGDNFWSVYTPGYTGTFPDWSIKESKESKLELWLHDKAIKRFSTKEKAEEYILMNKPLNISIKELCPIIGKCNNSTYIDLDLLTKKLKELIKLK